MYDLYLVSSKISRKAIDKLKIFRRLKVDM
jgi:hypothetical protein